MEQAKDKNDAIVASFFRRNWQMLAGLVVAAGFIFTLKSDVQSHEKTLSLLVPRTNALEQRAVADSVNLWYIRQAVVDMNKKLDNLTIKRQR